jgi:peptidoglycan LD-endopeptidase LytH
MRLKQTKGLALILVAFLFSCAGNKDVSKIFSSDTPREAYAKMLFKSGLSETVLGKRWIEAGEKALNDSLEIAAPYKESGFFSAEKPMATGYRIEAKRGEKLIFKLQKEGENTQGEIFFDLYSFVAKSEAESIMKHISSAEENGEISFEAENNETLLLRVQPELLKSFRYTLTIEKAPQIDFPVFGNAKIGSFWGDPRDGGKRKHLGIDIFAPKGTPALAASNGIITGVNVNKLGGNVVWLNDFKRKQSYYYAHLDTQLVRQGQRVKAGDTLGLIGNTGNAKHTPPHLHFGVYKYYQGAIDPLPFVDNRKKAPEDIKFDVLLLHQDFRTKGPKANVRVAPNQKSSIVATLDKHTALWPISCNSEWLCVSLPDSKKGFIHKSLIEKAEKPLKVGEAKSAMPIYETAENSSYVVDSIMPGKYKVFAKFGNSSLVERSNGERGWVVM